MNKILFIFAFLLITTCKKAVEITEFGVEQNIKLQEESVIKIQNFTKSYIGKIGKIDVVFHLVNQNGVVGGYYFYQKKGSDIKLVGTLEKGKVILSEVDFNNDKTAIIEAELTKDKLIGTLKNLKTKKILNVELSETELLIPEIPDLVLGNYHESKRTDCNFKLSISKKFNDYFYDIKFDDKKLTGKISFNRSLEEQKVFIKFEGIKWAEYEGALDEEGGPINRNLELPVGIEGLWQEEEIFIQNFGNAMNYFTKFSECGDKFIILQKLGKSRDEKSTFYQE